MNAMNGVIRHGIVEREDGMPISCICGYNPWEEDAAEHDNSGPDESSIRNTFFHHFKNYLDEGTGLALWRS